ncbi:MAG: hypothetical protein KBI07_05175 [Candidatus Atribacteria bacterium]|nr:hypothetical protein [Candidatus Atribacteria bacterium]
MPITYYWLLITELAPRNDKGGPLAIPRLKKVGNGEESIGRESFIAQMEDQ